MRATVWLVSALGAISGGVLAVRGFGDDRFLDPPALVGSRLVALVLLAMVILPQFALPAVGRWEGLIAPAAGDFRITWIEGTAQPRP